MSEYQYFEFRALDKPLTREEMGELRACSSRAQITPTSFVNVYNWGDFKGNSKKWMEKYFDAFLYVANWGTRRLVFRVPKLLFDVEAASAYCADDGFSFHLSGDYAILSFDLEEDGGEWEEGEGWLSSLIQVRTDLLRGDVRSLYLGWLCAVQMGCIDDDTPEPPVPAGLAELSESLQSLGAFLRIDPDLIDAAAENSAPGQATRLTQKELAHWIDRMSSTEKDAALVSLLEDEDGCCAITFRQRAIHDILGSRDTGSAHADAQPRSVGQLLARTEAIALEKEQRRAAEREREKARREREEAERRSKYLHALIGKEDLLWREVDELIATKQPKRYDKAVSLLLDLSELAALNNQSSLFTAHMDALRLSHVRKPALLERFRKVGLTP